MDNIKLYLLNKLIKNEFFLTFCVFSRNHCDLPNSNYFEKGGNNKNRNHEKYKQIQSVF